MTQLPYSEPAVLLLSMQVTELVSNHPELFPPLKRGVSPEDQEQTFAPVTLNHLIGPRNTIFIYIDGGSQQLTVLLGFDSVGSFQC